MRGATHLEVALVVEELVSTHAPLAGSDLRHEGIDPAGESFNPRSPCGERPEPKRTTLTKEGFNPRSPCGERYHGPQSDPGRLVSTHAPLAGSDEGQIAPSQPDLVSTHAPLAGSDRQAPWCTCAGAGFNPRSPCGERRPPAAGVASLPMSFNPRSPCGERPRVRARTRVSHGFNPRSPCGERPRRRPCGCGTGCFNPRSPCGERPGCASSRSSSGTVSTHAPLAGSDTAFSPSGLIEQLVSTHAPLAGSDGTVSHPRW